jgi:hypothetical protein
MGATEGRMGESKKLRKHLELDVKLSAKLIISFDWGLHSDCKTIKT